MDDRGDRAGSIDRWGQDGVKMHWAPVGSGVERLDQCCQYGAKEPCPELSIPIASVGLLYKRGLIPNEGDGATVPVNAGKGDLFSRQFGALLSPKMHPLSIE